MTTLVLALWFLQIPAGFQGAAGAELIDFSKIGFDNAQTTLGLLRDISALKKRGHEINEAGIIAALHDKDENDPLNDPALKRSVVGNLRNAAASLVVASALNVNLRTPAVAAALRDA